MLLELPAEPLAPKAEIEVIPAEDTVRGHAEAEVKVLFTQSSRIYIQDVFVQPFSEAVAAPVLDQLTEDVAAPLRSRWASPPDFRVVTARLTCVPSPACRFTWLRVGFDLGSESPASAPPVACALFPVSRQDTVKITSSVEISGKLTIKVAETAVKRKDGSEYERREFSIKTYGAFSPTPAWDFQKTEVTPEVTGDLTLVMVVAQPSGISSQGQVSVSVRAQLRSGSLIALLMRRTAQNAASLTFPL